MHFDNILGVFEPDDGLVWTESRQKCAYQLAHLIKGAKSTFPTFFATQKNTTFLLNHTYISRFLLSIPFFVRQIEF